MDNQEIQIVREPHLAEKIVFVDGQEGCGKTMLSPIVAALERVELLTFPYPIEHICCLNFLKKIEFDAAVAMVRMLTDLRIYNDMMSREVNFRPSDQSSVFHDAKWFKYLLRLFQQGDRAIPQRIAAERPILNLTTHKLLSISEPVFNALGNRVVFIEMVRHPLYMLKQDTLNMDRLINNARDFVIYFSRGNKTVPCYAFGWEDLFLRSNSVEKAIYKIQRLTERTEVALETFLKKYSAQILIIPFEQFVTNPWPYMKKIEALLETKITFSTRRMMKRQRVPRKVYSAGAPLKIYKRCGWEPPKSTDENNEFALRRQFALQSGASREAMAVLDRLSADYEEKYLGGKKDYRSGGRQ